MRTGVLRKLLGGIRVKLTGWLLVFAAMPAIGGFVSVVGSEGQFRAMGLQRAGDAAVQLTETIDRNLLQRYADVQAFALNRATQVKAYYNTPDYPNPLTDAMNAYMRVYGVYKLMALVDPQGKVLAVPNIDGAGKPLDTLWLYDHQFKDAPWLKKAVAGEFLQGRNGLTGTVVEPPAFVPEVARLHGSDGYSLAFAAPVRDKDGKPIAVWVNFADFGVVDDILATAYQHLSAGGMPGTEIVLLDQKGRTLAAFDPEARAKGATRRNPAALGKAPWQESGAEPVARVLKGDSGATQSPHPMKGSAQALGYAHSNGANDFPGLHWSALVLLPESELFATINQLERQLLLMGLGAAVLTLLAGLGVGTLMSRPIQRLTGAMDRLTHGDLEAEVPGTARGDEIGGMARAVEVFKDNTIAMRRLEREQKEHDARAEVEKRQMMQQLADRFEASVNQVVETVANSSTELEYTAQSMAQTADQTSRLSTVVAGAAEEATRSVQTAAYAAESLAASIEQINAKVSQSTSIARAAVDRANSSQANVQSLNSAAQKIGEAVSLIHRIAGQTNILALNATIEAASAGEAGKGFAVVASEVKALANQTARAADEIRHLIASVQAATGDATAAMTDIGAIIGRIDEVAADIAAAVVQQHTATLEIARSTQVAVASTVEVSANIAKVSTVASDAESAAENVLSASHGVTEQSGLLRTEVERFLRTVRG
ncbi:methyl-accepting chemotaxis protein [Azospirillum sp.]|uniref:methyl-accepting chemotaxis protein n=1 Tax=Azospirillum sp. TaxID=34012 RepID=UPI003D73DA55